jgi:MFS family permease
VSAVLSLGTAALVAFGSREVRPAVVPEGRVLELAFGAIRAVLGDPAVRRIFAVFAVSFLAAQTARPYIPILVEALVGRGPGLASSIALVVGTASLVGAVLSPAAGALGDRIGFQRVLVVSLAALGIGLGLMTVAPTVPLLALIAVAVAGAQSTVSAMVFGLLATEVAPERRSTTLNLVYLPLYIAGIVGPAVSAGVVGLAGLRAPFLLAAAVGLGGAVGVALRRRAIPAPPAGQGP